LDFQTIYSRLTVFKYYDSLEQIILNSAFLHSFEPSKFSLVLDYHFAFYAFHSLLSKSVKHARQHQLSPRDLKLFLSAQQEISCRPRITGNTLFICSIPSELAAPEFWEV